MGLKSLVRRLVRRSDKHHLLRLAEQVAQLEQVLESGAITPDQARLMKEEGAAYRQAKVARADTRGGW